MTEITWSAADSSILLSGTIDFDSVVAMREQGRAIIAGYTPQHLSVDFAAVTKANSTALTLMLAFLRDAKQQGKSIAFTNVPESLQRLAKATGVEKFLPVKN